MRSSGRLKLGYYPLPSAEGLRLRQLLQADQSFSIIDPCVGTGAALHLLTAGMDCNRYGIELDADRAIAASASGIATIQGSTFQAHAKVESFSVLYLNPPYDSEIGSFDNERMEFLFLEHTYRWLVQGGLLIFVVPEARLKPCVSLLATSFHDFRMYRLTDPESERYKQVVLTAIRKPMRGIAQETNRNQLLRLMYYGPFGNLNDEQEPYPVPASSPAEIAYRGLPLDQVEDLLPLSPVWKQVAPLLLPREEMTTGRPITPLHAGHVGLLCTAGLLNGVFGSAGERHIARWRTVKYTTTIHEEEDDATIVRKRERFSNELALAYEGGRMLLLTESPKVDETKEQDHEQRALAAGAA